MNKYALSVYMTPYWAGNTVYHEAVLVLEDPDGTIPDIDLLYPADRLIAVRSADLQTQYREGADYTLVDGRLHIPVGSRVPKMSHADYYPAQPTEFSKRRNEQFGDGYIFFTETSRMHLLQLAVTYTHRGSIPAPPCKKHLLPQTAQRLQTSLKLCVYGDSICVGANASAFLDTTPFAPTWWQMFADQLTAHYPQCRLQLQNPSVGGKDSAWGAQEADRCVGYGPELCIIGFGMNDGTRRIAPEAYLENIRAIMAAARKGNPRCEFVLLAPILPNEQVGRFLGRQAEYLSALETLEAEGVAVADMTGFHQLLLARKRYWDMSANNVNHPNDFLSRAYAQVLWQTVFGL